MDASGVAFSKSLSIVVPCFDEADVLVEFHRRLTSALANQLVDIEIIYINDGSTDSTADVIGDLRKTDHRVGCVNLSRNFGKESALSAGLDHARGDAIVFIDADLQDPPECIPSMLDAWRRGIDVVAMKRADRSSETAFKRASAFAFYRLLSVLSDVDIPENVGDFRLLSRRAADALRSLPERNRYMKGLFAWVGFKTVELEYKRESRLAGKSKWPVLRLIRLAFDGITSFSIAPLRLASFGGATVALLSVCYAVFVVVKTLVFGEAVAGFPTLAAMVAFLGGVQLMAVGLLGEYIGRLMIEGKGRPLYIVQDVQLPAEIPVRRTSGLIDNSIS
ncbi:MAG: glycosyltransferase family 2 protein [Pseudomonadota bacterium]